MKDKLGRKIMIKFVGLRIKTYSYLINDASEDKKQKVQKRVLIIKAVQKQFDLGIKLECIVLKNPKQLIKNNKLIFKTHQRFKSDRHNVFTEEIDETALISNDDKRM